MFLSPKLSKNFVYFSMLRFLTLPSTRLSFHSPLFSQKRISSFALQSLTTQQSSLSFPHFSFCSTSGGSVPLSKCQQQSLLPSSSFAQNATCWSYQNHSFSNQTFPDSESQNSLPSKPEQSPKKMVYRVGVIASSLYVLAGKTKFLLVALKLAKFPALISLLVSTAAYTYIFGLPFAVGMMSQIILHESGHALAMKHYGIPFSPMVFIPFMGASVMMKELPSNAEQDANIALAGPVLGGAGAIALTMAGILMDSQLLMSLANFGLIINLFNLLPIGQLDGGRIANVLSKWLLLGGFGLGLMILFSGVVSNPLFYLIMIFAGYSTFSRFAGWNVPPYLTSIPSSLKIKILGAYLGSIITLLYFLNLNSKYLKPPNKLRSESVDGMSQSKESEFTESIFLWSDAENISDKWDDQDRKDEWR
jgi:Zn-dependent protease